MFTDEISRQLRTCFKVALNWGSESENFPDDWKGQKSSEGVESRFKRLVGQPQTRAADASLQAEVVSMALEEQIKLAVFYK